MKPIQYKVKRGKNKGIILTPHLYEGGYYQAYKTNSRNDPVGKQPKTLTELYSLVMSGYHVRMSNPAHNHSPSTVKPDDFD